MSLGAIAATVLNKGSIEDGIQATHRDADMVALHRIVMQCQIIDDVLDFSKDLHNGLPSFLTAHASLSEALALTSVAATQYATMDNLTASPHVFPFRVALWGMSALARVAIMLGQWRLSCTNGLRRALQSVVGTG